MSYYDVLGPLIRLLPPEHAHGAALHALQLGLVPSEPERDTPSLATTLAGLPLANPVGLAAGFDKDAVAVGPLLARGFGFVEVGTVTPHAQKGNPRPRLFRLVEDRAVINRMGFNNAGAIAMGERLTQLPPRGQRRGLVGVNLGKWKNSVDPIADYVEGVRTLGLLADYLVINVSSPNTPGLRALQGKTELEALATAAMQARTEVFASSPPPLFIKIAPDLTDEALADVVAVAQAARVEGLIVTNTTLARPDGLQSRARGESGGLSGRPLRELSLRVLREVARVARGSLVLVGVGGIESGADAYARIRAGAQAVQLYSALIYAGLPLVTRIKVELAALLARDGLARVSDAVGLDL